MSTHRTYLDHNATAPLRPQAAEAFARALQAGGNASSVHVEGRAARARIEHARDQVAALVKAPAAGVVFTSGGTEANNLAIAGCIAGEGVARLLVSSIEHPSVLEPSRAAGVPVREIAVTAQGVIDFDDLAVALAETDDRALLSVMLANNETGAVQPIAEIVRMAREYDVVVHADAVQAAAKIDVDFDALGVNLLSLSSHKLGGPQGAGALLTREGVKLRAQMHGGGQETRRRAGTENVAAIVGFGAAAEAAADSTGNGSIVGLRDDMEKAIAIRLPDARILCADGPRLPNTTCLMVPRVQAEYLLIALDLEGFAVSSGSACSSGKVARSHVLSAMGIADELSDCAIRISIGWDTSEQELERFVAALAACCERKKSAVAEAAA